jgi:stage II sporulation protein D
MRFLVLLVVVVLLPGAVRASVEGGGRDVSVALFTTQPVRSVLLTPVGAGAWMARCARCAHEPLTRAVLVSGGMEVFAGGTLRVSDGASYSAGTATGTATATGAATMAATRMGARMGARLAKHTGMRAAKLTGTRTATGLWHLRSHAAQRVVDVVLTLPSERYVAAVLNAEPAAHEPAQSLRAMAIVTRTYALNGRHYTPRPGHLAADLCDSTACQMLLLRPSSSAVEEATRATAGETLWFGGHRAEVYFSQSCGGLTEDARAVWHGARNEPYLRSHADPYCLRRSRDAWHAEVSLQALRGIAKVEGWRVPVEVVAAQVVERSSSHRALRVRFTGSDGRSAVVAGNALRMAIGRALGWSRVRSDAYELGLRHGALVFDGQGHGHGVGLCQLGATEMASEGKSAREILGFYFPGTAVRVTAADRGGQGMQDGR